MINFKKAHWPTFEDRAIVGFACVYAFLAGWMMADRRWTAFGLSVAIVVAHFVVDRIQVARQKINRVEIELENEFVIDIRNRDATRTPAYPTEVRKDQP